MFDVTLNNGVRIPVLGLGVYKVLDQAEMDHAITYALEAGYRSFDTAQLYGNEAMLGEALEKTGMARGELFLTSKVQMKNTGYDQTLASFEESLKALRTEYLDLFLIHWPGQQKKRFQETWRALETLYEEKMVRAIGVCNCLPRHLEWIAETAHVVPAVNQIERQPLFDQKEIFQYCQARGIQCEAWAPLLRGNFDLPPIRKLAEKYGKTPAQIILRWDVQSGYIVIPKSVHKERILENIDVFDFSLSEDDMRTIGAMNHGMTTGYDLETYDY